MLGLVECHEVQTSPLLKLLQVPLGGILSSRSVSCTTQLVESWGVPMASKMYWRSDKIPLLSLSSSLIHALLFNRVTSRKWLFNQVVQRDFLIFFFFPGAGEGEECCWTLTGIGKISQYFPPRPKTGAFSLNKILPSGGERMFVQIASSEYQMLQKIIPKLTT